MKKSQIALVHCRKASVGLINEKTAQPVIIYKNNKVDFVVMHNGTIYNYEALAKKYIPEINITGMTDSQVMAHIFYYKGYDVLNEYNGGAVFVIVDYRHPKPKTFIFKGQSKVRKNDKEASEERPLFFHIDRKKQELVFSSIASYLIALRTTDDVYILTAGYLFEFTGTELVSRKKYDRSDCIQTKIIEYTPKVTSNYYYNVGSKYWDDDSYSDMYLTLNYLNNLYSYKGKKCEGEYIIGSYGYVYDSKPLVSNIHIIYFFDGIPMYNKECYDYICQKWAESQMSLKEFHDLFENFIRWFSVDKLYIINNTMYTSVSPIFGDLFTGEYHPLISQQVIRYKDGLKLNTFYDYTQQNHLKKTLEKERDYDFKEIDEQWKLLMS